MRIIKTTKKGKKSKEAIQAEKAGISNRIKVTGAIAFAGLAVVSVSLANIIFMHGPEYSKQAYNQQVKNKIISPNRGTIFDTNGEILAMSVSVSTVSINPGKVKFVSGKDVPDELLISGFSKYLSNSANV